MINTKFLKLVFDTSVSKPTNFIRNLNMLCAFKFSFHNKESLRGYKITLMSITYFYQIYHHLFFNEFVVKLVNEDL